MLFLFGQTCNKAENSWWDQRTSQQIEISMPTILPNHGANVK